MSLRQIVLVLKREYVTRIRSKAFIIATILIPLGMVALIGLGIAISVWDSEGEHAIGVVDRTNSIYTHLHKMDKEQYLDLSSITEDSLRRMILGQKIDGYIVIDEENIASGKNVEFIYGGSGGLSLISGLSNDIREAIRQERLQRARVSEEVQQIYNSSIGLNTRKLTKEGRETEDDTGFLAGVGIVMGVIIFTALFGYGGLLTRSVIEEKTSRIVEIIASSVKPIELLLGKMAGIGALGLTQIIIWITAFFGLSTAAAPIAAMFLSEQAQSIPELQGSAGNSIDPSAFQIPAIEPGLIAYFLIFFVLGYLIYSSFFAAIGAAVDSETDTQQFMIPIMIPIMIAYFIMFRVMENPDGSLAVFGSIFPLFSPIVMITRVAITEVPFWQIVIAIMLLVATFFGAMWLSAKIYSVGILSYGKSASFRELIKWIKQG